jgi:putative ABC transport system ATP-binding protein
VAIARAIAMQPRILLADEPTGNLDTQSGEQILAILEELRQQGITLVVVTHDPAVARRADRILALRDGEIVQRLSASEFTDTSALSISAEPGAHS